MIFEAKQNALGLEELKEEWNGLLEKSPGRSITQTWPWVKTWWDVYGKDRNLLILCGYKDDKLVGIAPLSIGINRTIYFGVINFRTIWVLGSGKTRGRGVVSDYLDLIVESGHEEEFINGLVQYLKGHDGWDEMILENISSESPCSSLLTKSAENNGFICEIIARTPTILIKLPDSWETYLNSISSSLRYNIRRGRQEFKKLGGSYHLMTEEGELKCAFTALERLHQQRWKSKGEPGAFSSVEWKAFHEKLISLIFKKGWLKMSLLKLNGDPIAANYNFAYDKKIHFFQSGIIPHDNPRIKPGVLLHSYCIEEAIKEGFKEYDFLQVGGKGAGYKGMWGNCSRDLLRIRLSRRTNKERVYRCLNKVLNSARKMKKRVSG